MGIDKSRIIGKAIKDLPKDINTKVQTGDRHREWTKATTGVIDFLSRCTLRYANSYGATYQISQTKELTIISNKGQSYTLESYDKFLNLIIVDYQDSSEDKPMNNQPTPADIKVGTHWERLTHVSNYSPKGEIITITKVTDNAVIFCGGRDLLIMYFLENFKPRPDLNSPDTKRGLAFYKESGASWTADEYQTIINYCGDTDSSIGDCTGIARNKNKYIYDDGSSSKFMHYWSCRSPDFYPENFTIHSYESIFCKPKPVASEKEANPKPIKSENTLMKAIKETTLTTIDQNKQAAIIASKMEAGRILNKQIIKQIKPHVHVFLRGYLDTPLAPVILANLVALAGNHTDNKRIKQISELMLLAAANTTVQSFNLDQIIDNVLKNIKLPAGILDDNDDDN